MPIRYNNTMEFWFILSAVVISIVSVMIYAGLAVFFPEWVGITGKAALDAEKSHRSGEDGQEWFDSKK